MLNWDEPRKLKNVKGYAPYARGGTWAESWKIAKAWHAKWKAWRVGGRIEIKKSIEGVHVLIKVYPSGTVYMSMNGTLTLKSKDRKELFAAIEEALKTV